MTTPPAAPAAPTPPPPPNYPPTAGLVTTWWQQPVQYTAQTLINAPTAAQVAAAKQAKTAAKAANGGGGAGDRHLRVRRWLLVNALSASVGYGLHLVQLFAHWPRPVTCLALAGVYAFELLKLRRQPDGSFVALSQVRGAPAFWLLVAVRVPVASALAALLGFAPLLALTTHI